MTKEKTKVLLVDENGFERTALHGFLEEWADANVVAEAEGACEAMAALEQHQVDMVIVNLPYELEPGLRLVRTVRARHPGLPVMILASHKEQLFAEHAVAAGADGYMLYHEIANTLPTAMDRLRCGGQYISACA